MKLTLDYTWDCAPEAFWALYYDPEFAVRMHPDALGSTSAEVVSQEGDLASGLMRTLRYRHTYSQLEGHWEVATMHITIDLVGDLGHHMLFDLAP